MVQALVDWFEENQRDLPWRASYDPYLVWVSEVMLQQTQVETALPYYERFIEAFPAVGELAKANERQVLALWAGLGYYRRAKNMMRAAGKIVVKYHGRIPAEYDDLIALPGIGQYTAGAILSIAFNKPYPIVDGNVRRVLSRLHGRTDESPKALWEDAARLVNSGEPRLVNQAVMELGAKICSFRSPRCLICPIQRSCIAFQTGMQEKIPAVKRRQVTLRVHIFAVICKRGSRYLMKAADGFWEFPTFAELPAGSFEQIGTCRHTITNHRLNVSVYKGELQTVGYRWQRIESIPTSSLTKKILATDPANLRTKQAYGECS